MKTKTTIGSFEAKTHLSQILEDVQDGEEITITKRGKPIAKIIPYREKKSNLSRKDILARFAEIKKSVKNPVNIKEFIEEGRKY